MIVFASKGENSDGYIETIKEEGSKVADFLLGGALYDRAEWIGVALRDGRPIGAVAMCEKGDIGDYEILLLYVLPGCRRDGVGRDLLNTAITRLFAKGAEEIGIRATSLAVLSLVKSLPLETRLHLRVVDNVSSASDDFFSGG